MSTSYITDDTPAGDFEKLSVSTDVKTPTASKLLIEQAGGFKKRAVKAFVTVETNTIRMRFDGTAPDSSTGHALVAGDFITVSGEQNVANIKMIRASADATVQITYYYNY